MSKPKPASDILARFRKTAEQPKPIAVVVPEAEETPRPPAEEPGGALSATTPQGDTPAPPKPKPKMVRYTLDLEPAQHKFLKRFALEAGVDSSRVLRVLLRRLEEDVDLSNAVMEELSK